MYKLVHNENTALGLHINYLIGCFTTISRLPWVMSNCQISCMFLALCRYKHSFPSSFSQIWMALDTKYIKMAVLKFLQNASWCTYFVFCCFFYPRDQTMDGFSPKAIGFIIAETGTSGTSFYDSLSLPAVSHVRELRNWYTSKWMQCVFWWYIIIL